MAKITKEEYVILKSLDDKWRWVARDADALLWVYSSKPYKRWGRWGGMHTSDAEYVSIDKFEFIQWEDEAPWNIQELIEEYEVKELRLSPAGTVIVDLPESEETEVKKDKRWFVDKWTKERNKTDVHDPMYHFINEFIADVNQLDEPEVTLDKAFEKVAESYSMTKEEVWRQLEQFEAHAEVLSQGWIKDHELLSTEKDADGNIHADRYIHVKDLQNLLVPEQEKVEEDRVKLIVGFDGGTESYYARDIRDALDFLTEYDTRFTVSKEPIIPQFVAEHIEKWKNTNVSLSYALSTLRDDLTHFRGNDEQTKMWLYHPDDGIENQELYARAWLDGYTVEEEYKYYARIKGWELFVDFIGAQYWGVVSNYGRLGFVNADGAKGRTKDEWKRLGINDTNADFIKAEELE